MPFMLLFQDLICKSTYLEILSFLQWIPSPLIQLVIKKVLFSNVKFHCKLSFFYFRWTLYSLSIYYHMYLWQSKLWLSDLIFLLWSLTLLESSLCFERLLEFVTHWFQEFSGVISLCSSGWLCDNGRAIFDLSCDFGL